MYNQYWKEGSMPEGKSMMLAGYDGDYIYGWAMTISETTIRITKKCELMRYDPKFDTWDNGVITELPVPRAAGISYIINEKLFYIAGGNDWVISGGGYNTTYGRMDIYNFHTGEWSTGKDKPTPSYLMGAEDVNGKLYCIGGADSSNKYLSVVEVYDPDTDIWSTEASLPNTVCELLTGRYKDKIYCFGGWKSNGHTNSLCIYDTNLKQWTPGASMLYPTHGGGTGALGDNIYCAGGVTGTIGSWNVIYTDKVQIYNIDSNMWVAGPELPTAMTPYGGTVIDGKLYCMQDNKMYILDPKGHKRLRLLLEQGKSQQLVGILLPSGATVEEVDWSSEDTSIVQVDEYGLATGISPGKAVVTVTAKDGSWSDRILIQVLEAEVEPEYRLSILLKTGEICRLAASDDPEEMFLWTSDDTGVATVSDTGQVTAIAPGVTIITVMSGDGAFEDRVYVKVED